MQTVPECGKVIWLAGMPKWPIATGDNCQETNALSAKAQGNRGSEFDCPTTVSHNTDVDSTAIRTFCLIKYRRCFTYKSAYLVDTKRCWFGT